MHKEKKEKKKIFGGENLQQPRKMQHIEILARKISGVPCAGLLA